MVWPFAKTDTEIKRDEYKRLYNRLNTKVTKAKEHLVKVQKGYKIYKDSVQGLSQEKVPFGEFEAARSRLERERRD